MSRRAILVFVICVAIVGFANLIALAIFGPRLWRAFANRTVASRPPSLISPSTVATPAPSGPSATPTPAHTPLPDGAVVQREEVSPSGKIRIKYTRSKGNPTRQILLEDATKPKEPVVFFEYQRNAWLMVSPNDEWIALNNRPKAGESDLQLYRRTAPDSLIYEIPEELQGDQQLQDAVWHYYVETMQLPADTAREGVTIDATGWDPDSKKLSVSVAVTPLSPDDKVPPPWSCTVDVESKDIEVSAETAEAMKQQESQTAGGNQTEPQNSPAAQNNPPSGSFPGEKFPATRERVLQDNEVATWGPGNIRYAIDEIYARHGADFSDNQQTRQQFSQFSWYHPRPQVTKEQIESEFSDIERQNLALLTKQSETKQASSSQKHHRQTKPTHTPNAGERFLHNVLKGLGR